MSLSVLCAIVAVLALISPSRSRPGVSWRRGFQLIWAIGMYSSRSLNASERLRGEGWSGECIERGYHGNASSPPLAAGCRYDYLLGRPFGYAYALLVFFGGFLAFVTRNTYGAGTTG